MTWHHIACRHCHYEYLSSKCHCSSVLSHKATRQHSYIRKTWSMDLEFSLVSHICFQVYHQHQPLTHAFSHWWQILLKRCHLVLERGNNSHSDMPRQSRQKQFEVVLSVLQNTNDKTSHFFSITKSNVIACKLPMLLLCSLYFLKHQAPIRSPMTFDSSTWDKLCVFLFLFFFRMGSMTQSKNV